MKKESKVLSTQRDGSTTIKKMLIDGHLFTIVKEGRKIIHKNHNVEECELCIAIRNQEKIQRARVVGDVRSDEHIINDVEEPTMLVRAATFVAAKIISFFIKK